MGAYPYKAKQRVEGLIQALEMLHERDPEQEVTGMALPVFDAVVEAIKDDIGRDNPCRCGRGWRHLCGDD